MERLHSETVLVSANALLREGLTRILGAAGFHITASGPFADDEARDALPNVSGILLIIDASDDFDAAIDQIEPLKRHCPTGRIAILVGQHQLQLSQMVSAFRAGASAYLTNFIAPEAFVKSLELVMLGETILPRVMLDELLRHQIGCLDKPRALKQEGPNTDEDGEDDDREEDDRGNGDDDFNAAKAASPDVEGNYSPHLSARQMSILHCLIEGDSNKAIARKMKIADATVKVHVKAILRRIGVDNRTQAAIWAMRNGSLISAGCNSSLCGEKPSLQRSPGLEFGRGLSLQMLSSGGKNDTASSPALGIEGVHHVAMPSADRPNGKGLHQKNS